MLTRTIIPIAALLFLLTGMMTAAPVPVVGPPYGACNTVGSGCLNGGNLVVQIKPDTCTNFFNGNNPDVCGVSGNTFSENALLDPNVFTIGATGIIKDLTSGDPTPSQFISAPGPLGTVIFDLSGVNTPLHAACPANPTGSITCSLGMFTISQQDLNTSGADCPVGQSPCGHVMVGFSFTANAYLGTSATGSTPYQINFSSRFYNETVADLIAKANQADGIVNAVTFTANPVAPLSAQNQVSGCPATRGFWSNAKQHPFPASLTFPITLGGISYNKNDFYAILGASGNGNAVSIMGSQLITAILNIAANGQSNAAILNAIAQALGYVNGINMVTGYVASTSPLGQQMLSVKDTLEAYNSGFFGTCTDGTGLLLGPK
jgi:hypothetical protein